VFSADLEGPLEAAGVVDAARMAAIFLDCAVADAVEATGTGVRRLALQIGHTGQTQGHSNPLAHAPYPCPRN
jgi:hypothetical protein